MELACFWAKTTKDNKPGISVCQHMVNIGCVAQCLANIDPGLLHLFKLRSSEVGALAALHDVGKISPGFQRKCQAWLEEHDLVRIERNGAWATEMEGDHGKVSHAIIQKFLDNQSIPRIISSRLACVLGAHHGKLTVPMFPAYAGMNRYSCLRSRYRKHVPRVCGDEPSIGGCGDCLPACSPRMRG